MARYSGDPTVITARFRSRCSSSRKTIFKGDECVYYPRERRAYHMDSKQAEEYRKWEMDVEVLDRPY